MLAQVLVLTSVQFCSNFRNTASTGIIRDEKLIT